MYHRQQINMSPWWTVTYKSSAKEKSPTIVFANHSAAVRFDFADDVPFFLVRFTFMGSGVPVRGISSSTT